MSKQKDSEKKNKSTHKPSLLGIFLTKEKPDKTFFPELKDQWNNMSNSEKFKFILGAFVGLIIFAGALALVYYLLVLIRG